jgi:alcohol dehydrogenase
MRAVVYHGPGQKAWEEVPDPEIIDESDIIVRVDAATICGTDLHILKGDVPAVRNGRILNRVLVSCISALKVVLSG